MDMNMDILIKLRIQLDYVTGKISAYCERKPIRYFLRFLQIAAIAFLIFDSYVYGVTTGETTLFSSITIVVVTSLMMRKKGVGRE